MPKRLSSGAKPVVDPRHIPLRYFITRVRWKISAYIFYVVYVQVVYFPDIKS